MTLNEAKLIINKAKRQKMSDTEKKKITMACLLVFNETNKGK